MLASGVVDLNGSRVKKVPLSSLEMPFSCIFEVTGNADRLPEGPRHNGSETRFCFCFCRAGQQRRAGGTALSSGMVGSSHAVPSQSIMVASARCSQRCEHRPGSGRFDTDQARKIAVHCVGSDTSLAAAIASTNVWPVA